MKDDVFIAYRRNNGGYEIAGRLYERLSRMGYRCFFDENLSSGKYDENLMHKIEEATDFIVVLPVDSLKAREGKDHFIDEIEFALKKEKNIIPILLDGYDPKPNELDQRIRELHQLEHPMRIFRPQVDKEKKDFQKSAFNGMVNDLVARQPKKLLHSKKVNKIRRNFVVVVFAFLVVIIFLLGNIKIWERDMAIKKENRELSSKLEEIENQIHYWDGNIAQHYESGDGSIDNPYVIATPEQLALLSYLVREGNSYEDTYFRLANDIYLNSNSDIEVEIDKNEFRYVESYKHGWSPIGTEEVPFAGNFDGNGKLIYGVYISDTQKGCQGLFGMCSSTSVITDITVTESTVIVEEDSSCIGIVCGRSDGIINKTYVKDSYVRGMKSVGGVVGDGDIILNSGAYGVQIGSEYLDKHLNDVIISMNDFIGSEYFGGIAGRCTVIVNSQSYRNILYPPGFMTGGLVGMLDLEIYNCISTDNTIGLDFDFEPYISYCGENDTTFPFADNVACYFPALYRFEESYTSTILSQRGYSFSNPAFETSYRLLDSDDKCSYVYKTSDGSSFSGFAGSNQVKKKLSKSMDKFYPELRYSFELDDYMEEHDAYLYDINSHDYSGFANQVGSNIITSSRYIHGRMNANLSEKNIDGSLVELILNQCATEKNIELEKWEHSDENNRLELLKK